MGRASTVTERADMSCTRVRIGQLEIDAVTFPQALERIAKLVDERNGGAVFTPNVDHVVKAERHADFRRAYSHADLCLADGMPLVWASRLLGLPLPEKVSGSDLVLPLVRLAAKRRWRVYLLGGGPGVAEQAGEKLGRELGALIVGTDSPVVDSDGSADSSEHTLERLRAASPDLVLVAFGAPKQELWIDRFSDRIGPAVAIGVGGSLDFITGKVKRAPAWMSRAGLEWLYRLLQEPRRMWRRYLVEDPAFIAIVARSRRRAGRRPSL
jgi:N-acetylglucosaminyldiphosphoundecaprenol N-acetyl-beta-D-mannosaminyltransferase